MSNKVIEELLQACFAELQHDTGAGETEPEYQHQRRVLSAEFRRILATDRAARPVAGAGAAVAWEVGLDLYRSHDAALKGVRDPFLKPLPLYRAAPSARTLPKLTDAMIEAAIEAHYGKRRTRAVGGAEGVDMTANDINYSAKQAFKRMWAGAASALAASAPAEAPSVRDQALEEAARICDQQAERAPTSPGSARADACAAAIRALQGKPEAATAPVCKHHAFPAGASPRTCARRGKGPCIGGKPEA
jgi:hypothetical protein